MKDILNVGVVGAGAISGIYLENMVNMFSNIRPVAVCAAHLERAQARADQFGIDACTLEQMLARTDVDIIVNLTPVSEHYSIVKQALLAGKHAYTEKTIAASVEQAKELCALADEKGLYLGSAPDTFLGAAVQGAKKLLDEGAIGEVNSFSISINRSNDILTNIFPFLRLPGAGVLRDYEVYYLTVLVSLLGPASRTCALVRAPYQERINRIPGTKDYGETVRTPNESVVSAILEMDNGVVGTIHQNHESIKSDRADFAIYGREGVLLLSNPNYFGGTVKLLKDEPGLATDTEPDSVVTIAEPGNEFSGNCRGLGVSEMADAILHGRPNKATKEQALHVLSILEAMEKSNETGQMVDICSVL